MIEAIVGIVVSALGVLAMYTKVIRHITALEVKLDQCIEEMKRDRPGLKVVPTLAYKVQFIEKHLGLSVPEIQSFSNGTHE